jgi:hypothetical protein
VTKRAQRGVFRCPNCGAGVKVGALACRECGSDANTGWQDDAEIDYAQVDLPDGYRDDAVGDELPPSRAPRWVVVTALVVAVVMIAWVTGVFSVR